MFEGMFEGMFGENNFRENLLILFGALLPSPHNLGRV